MDNIILQSQKDAKKLSTHPHLMDAVTWKGFIKYFLYRNSLPFVREITFIAVNLAEFFLVLYFFGQSVGVGSAIASVFLFFKNSFWKSFLFSLRDKIFELKVSKELKFLPEYFYSYTFWGMIYWLANVAAGLFLIHIGSPLGKLIFMHKLASSIFALIASTYFISAYTLSRVYISMPYTIANRVLNLLLVVLLYKFIGIYAFIISFYLVGMIDLFITLKYCKKIFVKNEINFHIGIKKVFSSLTLAIKKTKEKHIQSFKKIATFFLIYFQPLLIIYLVNIYYRDYLIEYFLFYTLLNMFFLIPNRISKSMYYDSTILVFNHNFSMLKNLFYKNIVVTIILAFVSAAILMGVVSTWTLPQRWSGLYLELLMINKWQWLYVFIILSFPIKLIHYVLLVSESFTYLTALTLLFDYILLAALFLMSEYSENILYLFFIKGQLSPYYLIALLAIFISGIWKKDSRLASLLHPSTTRTDLVSKKQFAQLADDAIHFNPIVCLLILDHKYVKTVAMENICTDIKNTFNTIAITRISNNTLLVVNDKNESDIKKLNLEYKSKFGVFCVDILLAKIIDIPALISNSKGHAGLDGANFVLNQMYPKLQCSENNLDHQLNVDNLDKFLTQSGIKYRKMTAKMIDEFIEIDSMGSKRANEINSLCMRIAKHNFTLPDNILLKKDYFGLLPVITHGELVYIYELENIDTNKFKLIIRSLSFQELRGLCGVY